MSEPQRPRQQVPAICQNCGTLFPGGVGMGPGASVTMTNMRAGPCPRCGGWGVIPDGTYRAVENALLLFLDPRIPPERLSRVEHMIRDRVQAGESPQSVARAVTEELPQAESFFQQIRSNNLGALSLLVAILNMALTHSGAIEDNVAAAAKWIVEQVMEGRVL